MTGKTKERLGKLCAAAAAAVMCICMTAPAYAEFTDPALAYAQFSKGKNTTTTLDAGNTDSTDNTDDELPDDGDTELPDDTDDADDADDEVNGDDDETEQPSEKKKNVPASQIVINSYKSSVTVGDTFKIGYKLKPADSDDKVTYSVSNSAIVSVDSSGNVTALKKGSAIITVTASSGVKDKFTVTVKAAAKTSVSSKNKGAKSIELKHTSVTIYEGDKYPIPYELSPADCGDTVKFRTMNNAVASVDSEGVITARGKGVTWVTCTTGSGKIAKLKIYVEAVMTDAEKQKEFEASGEKFEREYDENGNLVPSLVRFAEESVSVRVGSTVSLNARIYPAGAKYKYTIKSDDNSVARVNVMGEVTGVSEGTAVITLTTSNGKSDTVSVTVYGDVTPGIDVSKWNGDINWKKVKRTGKAGFAMIRASYGYEDTDPLLDANVRGCEANGIPYGFYHYMYARNVSEAHKEAAYFLNTISKYSPEYPVVLDIEEEFYDSMSKKEVTAIVKAFMEDVEDAGYYAMIYSFAKFFDKNLYISEIRDYDIWVACWGDEEKLFENYSYHYGMWQYSETGRLDGIEEDVDLNYSYKDYRAIIRKYGLNRLR